MHRKHSISIGSEANTLQMTEPRGTARPLGSRPARMAPMSVDTATAPGPLLTKVRVEGFRTLNDATFQPGPVSALVGEPGTGKSNLLSAIRAVLDPVNAPLTTEDVARDGVESIRIGIETGSGEGATLQGRPPDTSLSRRGETPSVVYIPASRRTERLIDPPLGANGESGLPQSFVLHDAASGGNLPAIHERGSTEAAHGLVAVIEEWVEADRSGMVVLIEEPELFLPPQTQRYLYRILRRLTTNGNQVFYSTHSPSFLNVGRLHELVLTEHDAESGTRLIQPEPLPPDEEFRANSEFDATRSELFLARAAILVEGQTERLALPFVFHALGHDPDRERISIVECGGKPNIPVIARVAKAVGVPFLAVHDRDAPMDEEPNQAEQSLNELIGGIAGSNRIELIPDFEGVAGLKGRKHKPARAWRSFAALRAEEMPDRLTEIAEMAVALTRD